MAENRIENTIRSDLTNVQTDFSVDPISTDASQGEEKTRWSNTDWEQQFGYYKTIAKLRAVTDAKTRWTIGKGIQADEITEMVIDSIKGIGNESFNVVMENMIRTMHISGDSYAEIIRDEEGNIINLKPLDPGNITIVTSRKGIILEYEQMGKASGTPPQKITTERMFHLSRNRVADEIHGVSMIDALVPIILAKGEAFADMKKLMHRHVKPMRIFNLKTNDKTKRNDFKKEMDLATEYAENLYIPEGTVTHEVLTVAGSATLNPIPWIQYLDNEFTQVSGVPQIVLGGSTEITEASAKMAYLAFQQTIEEDQLYIEEQVLGQLDLEIDLVFPASLENELLSDEKKDEENGGAQPNDTEAGSGEDGI